MGEAPSPATMVLLIRADGMQQQRAFAERDLSQVDYVYLWADGIHVNIRRPAH